MSTFISLHAAAREVVDQGRRLDDALRGRRHTRASVADELAQPAADLPPIYRSMAAGRDGEVRR